MDKDFGNKPKPITYREEKGCHICTSHKSNPIYPRIRRNGKRITLHRYIWENSRGRKIPTGMIIRHTCDNPACINPQHLRLGTHKDNTQDMFKRGRAGNHKGENNAGHRLTEIQVKEILNQDDILMREMAERYDVCYGTIYAIRTRRTWGWLIP